MPKSRPRPILNGQPRRTRRHLLIAATQLLADPGYTAVTSDRIAEHAGYTRGAVYGHFRSKADLADAVLDRVCDLAITRTTRQVATQQHSGHLTTFEEFVQLVTSRIEELVQDPTWTRLELALAANRGSLRSDLPDASLGRPQRLTRLTTAFSRLVGITAADMGHTLAVEPNLIVNVLLAMVLGMTFCHDNPDTAETIEPLVRHLLRTAGSAVRADSQA
ncbi:TetR/AcrR family transcriptional regulator [Nocardia colli]|uniref:TetR/AcrR family transcriptional regulator n=1 Tax=Nocardia colli TaxID=2545717 RepID=UPI0035D815B8